MFKWRLGLLVWEILCVFGVYGYFYILQKLLGLNQEGTTINIACKVGT